MIAPVDVTNVHIETDRLLLRAWQETDLEDFYEYAKVDGVGQMAGWLPHLSMDESKTILGFFIEQKKTFALELKENGKVIGSLSLDEQDEDISLPENSQGRELGFALWHSRPDTMTSVMPGKSSRILFISTFSFVPYLAAAAANL